MTNTQQITMNQTDHQRRTRRMYGWTEQTQMVVRARIRDREAEAASERLAATARTIPQAGVRRTVGRLLIGAGRRIAGESATAGPPAARPASTMAA